MKSDQDSCSVPGFDVGLEALLTQCGEILSEFCYAQDIVLHVLKVAYSRVPNKRTGLLLENGKKFHLYALIRNCTFINFLQKVGTLK